MYNFLVGTGNAKFNITVTAKTEDAAIDIIVNEYPPQEGGKYMLN